MHVTTAPRRHQPCFCANRLTSKTSMEGWWMVQQMVRPVEQMFLTTLHSN